MHVNLRLTLVALILMGASWLHAATFQLQAVLSKETYGPFEFRSGNFVKVESGVFKLQILQDRSFKLVSSDTGEAYGVYELTPGRIIDVGDVLFTITDIKTPPPPVGTAGNAAGRQVPVSRSMLADTALGLEIELLDAVKYDWAINGAKGENAESVDRNEATLRFRKSFLTGRLGLVTAADWDNTIAGDGSTFENATIEKGAGWLVGLGVDVPIFQDGRWTANVLGEVSYRQETLSLQYGAWEVQSIVSTTTTNSGASNVVTTTTNLDFINYDEDATLTETLVTLGASIAYEAPAWFIYAGLKTLPWSDAALDATVVVSDKKFEITFERNDPVMAYGGIGFILAGTKCYVEVEGGGENAVRLGLLKTL